MCQEYFCCWEMGSAEQDWPGVSTPIARGARAPGRWLLFKPGPLFCSLPLCAWRGFCCSLKRLNSCRICHGVRKCSADALGRRGLRSWGSRTSPPWARTLVGAAVRGAGSTRGTEGCATVAGERGPGAAGLLVKARCNSRLFPCPISILSAPLQNRLQERGRGRLLRHLPLQACWLLLAGFLARPSHMQPLHAWLIACLRPRGGNAFPALTTMAPGLPPSALIIQTRRMRPSSLSVCVSSRLLGLNCVSGLAPRL